MQYPKKIQIGFQEGTCPLSCKKCPGFGEHVKGIKKVQKMPLQRAKQLIDEIAQIEKVPIIQPHIVTEPFANEDLKEIIPYCCNKNISLSIITNGILLNKEWIDLLITFLNRNTTVSFSLDAVTQKTYEKVRGEYNLAELEETIKYLLDERGSKGPRISVNFVYEEDNYDEKDAFLEKWKNKVDAVHIGVALDEHKKIPAIYKVKDVNKKNKACPFLREVMVIDTNGEARVCSADAFGETNLGNVFEKGILSVWNGEKMKTMLHKHKQSLLQHTDFCFECEWGYSLYNFGEAEETDDFIIKKADYAVYYNRKEKR